MDPRKRESAGEAQQYAYLPCPKQLFGASSVLFFTSGSAAVRDQIHQQAEDGAHAPVGLRHAVHQFPRNSEM